MKRILLCSGILRRADSILLVRTRYAGQLEPLWTLPGGRQEAGESIVQTLERELMEETSLCAGVEHLLYVSESLDSMRAMHVVNCTFALRDAQPQRKPSPKDPAVSEARFVPADEVPDMLRADVLRIPISEVLHGGHRVRYFCFKAEDVVVPFFS